MAADIPPGLIDIHSHILPGLDDGPANMEQSLAMARRYQALGVHCVVATPHWYRSTGWSATPEQIIAGVAEAQHAITGAGLALTILPGMEIGVADRLAPEDLATQALSLGPSGYYLIEFPLAAMITHPEQYLSHLQDQRHRVRVILAHPERCAAFQDNEETLPAMAALGVLVQMNIASVLGGFGPRVQRTALTMLARGQVHFLATDAHATVNRMPPDTGEWRRLTEYLGTQAVAAACDDNPRRLLAGEPVAPVAVDGERLDKYFPGYHTEKNNKMSKLAEGSTLAGRLRRLFAK